MDIKDINREYMDLILNRQEDYHEDYKFVIERVNTPRPGVGICLPPSSTNRTL